MGPQSAAVILKDLGAENVLDYSQTDIHQQLKKAGQFDVILDYSGQRKEADYIKYLRPGKLWFCRLIFFSIANTKMFSLRYQLQSCFHLKPPTYGNGQKRCFGKNSHYFQSIISADLVANLRSLLDS